MFSQINLIVIGVPLFVLIIGVAVLVLAKTARTQMTAGVILILLGIAGLLVATSGSSGGFSAEDRAYGMIDERMGMMISMADKLQNALPTGMAVCGLVIAVGIVGLIRSRQVGSSLVRES